MLQDLLELLLFALVCVVLGTIAYQIRRWVIFLVFGRTREAHELLVEVNLLRPRRKDSIAILCLSVLAGFVISALPGIYEGGVSNQVKVVTGEVAEIRDTIRKGAHPTLAPDPFARTKAIYTIHQQGPRLLVVSVGPDHVPQIAAENPLPVDLTDLTYDPTNGTRSAGDIWLEAEAPSR